MPVISRHSNYSYHATRWAKVRAVIENNAQTYIRTVDVGDPIRSQQYREDAILTNFTRLTREGLTGLVFRKPPTVLNLPEKVKYLEENATGDNLGIEQLAVRCVGEVLETGRYGLFVDYPKYTENTSSIDAEEAGLYARIRPYVAESIINYRCKEIGSKYVLSMIVLEEREDVYEVDMFTANQVMRYRVLYLDENNVYTYCVLDKNDAIIEGPFQPQDINGNKFNEIPFVFIGSENNDPAYDNIPLYDLAILNIGHYRNSADLEELGFVCGQVYPVVCVGDSSPEAFAAANPDGVKYGSRRGLTVGAGGSATLLQASPNQLLSQMMKDKLESAAALGARLIAPPGGRETAEGARIRYGSQNSALYILTENVADGIEKAAKWVCLYQGADAEQVQFELNKQFYDESADPNLIVQQIQLYDRGIIPAKELIDYGKKTGFISDNRTEEQLVAEAELNNPLIGADPNVIT